MKRKKENLAFEDVEVVYPDVIQDGRGKVKQDPIHIFVPEIFKNINFGREPLELGGIKSFLKMLLPPYTAKDPRLLGYIFTAS